MGHLPPPAADDEAPAAPQPLATIPCGGKLRQELRIELAEYRGRPYFGIRVYAPGRDGQVRPLRRMGWLVGVSDLRGVAEALRESARTLDARGCRPRPGQDGDGSDGDAGEPPPWERPAGANAKRDAFNRAIAPELFALWKSGMSQAAIAAKLNAEGRVNDAGRPWNQSHVYDIIDRYTEPDELAAARAKVRNRRSSSSGGAVAAPTAIDLRREGLTYEQVAERINADERFHSTGRWSAARVRRLIRRHGEPAEMKAISDALCLRFLGRGAAFKSEMVRAHDAPAIARMAELRRENRTNADIAAILYKEGLRNSAGKAYSANRVGQLLRPPDEEGWRPLGTGWRGTRPILIPGEEGEPAHVLGPGQVYIEKPPLGKAQRKVAEALLAAGPDGLRTYDLLRITGGARNVLKVLRRDPDWAAVIYPPDDTGGWRFGPPRSPMNDS